MYALLIKTRAETQLAVSEHCNLTTSSTWACNAGGLHRYTNTQAHMHLSNLVRAVTCQGLQTPGYSCCCPGQAGRLFDSLVQNLHTETVHEAWDDLL